MNKTLTHKHKEKTAKDSVSIKLFSINKKKLFFVCFTLFGLVGLFHWNRMVSIHENQAFFTLMKRNI